MQAASVKEERDMPQVRGFAKPFQTVFVYFSSHHRFSADLRDLQLYKAAADA